MLEYELVNGILSITQNGKIKYTDLYDLQRFIMRSETRIKSVSLLNCSNDIIDIIKFWNFKINGDID